MTVLRVLLAAAPAAGRAEAWALFDGTGTRVQTGVDRPADWPDADRIEIVLAASQARVTMVALPPMPPSRVASAAGFALEDQLAGPNAEHHVAVSAQAPDGRVRVAIASRSLLAAVLAHDASVARIVAESDLAASSADWRWCARESGIAGFVRRPDGSAFPADAPSPDGHLPAELTLALSQARRDGAAPARVRVDAPVDEPSLARWRRDTGFEFVGGAPWHWESASAIAFAGAIDLLPRKNDAGVRSKSDNAGRVLAPALFIAGIALALHVVATGADWAALKLEAWRNAEEWKALATAAGLPPDATKSPAAAQLALSRRYAEMRHAHGLPAPDDLLPLLARAAPGLAALPNGSVKRATYADGHWTLDLALADGAAIEEVTQRMRAAGVPTLVASSPGGTRMRLGGS
jgi:hypothetical protein